MKKYLSLLFFYSIFFLSCIKMETSNVTVTAGIASMQVTVKKNYTDSLGISKDSLIKNATVSIYATEDDRNNFQELGHQTTDTSGVIHFQNLTQKQYWLRITHPTFGEKLDDESTPPNTLSLVEIIY